MVTLLYAVQICAFVIFANLLPATKCEKHLLIDQLRLDFLNLEERLWKFVLWEAPTTNQENAEFHLIRNFIAFDEKLQQMPEDILRGLAPARSIKSFLFLYSELKTTENMYEKFRKFQDGQRRMNEIGSNDKITLLNDQIHLQALIRDILSPKTGANVTVHKVYDMLFGKENIAMEMFELLIKDFQCKNYFQSPQQVFYNLYNSIALNGLKNYVMIQFAYLASRIGDKGNYTELSIRTKMNFEHRVNETMSVFRGAMEIAPPTIWRCDPKFHVKDKTYVEMTRLLQGHIQNEVDMNVGGTCTQNCALYPTSTSHGCYDSESKYCQEMERCTGKLIGCRFVESHMDICLSKQSSRRYDYIQYESGKTMGQKSICWKKPVKSWWRWFVHCSYCMCLCDEQGPKSDRYVNMRPVVADTKNNRVVTGLRFVKHHRVIHLQIQEGKLLPYGYIDNATVHWVPVDEYTITDTNVYSGEDYFIMTYENRSMALDEVWIDHSSFNQVITGVRFIYDKMLRLQLLTRPFDWNNGSLWDTMNSTMYISSGGKHQIDLRNFDVPTRSPPTELDYNSDAYVTFTHTDFTADAAQTTIPYFDAQPVFSDPPVPLIGAGLQYKGKKGYGGFVAPKIATYGYSRLMKMQFPNADDSHEETTDNYPVFSA